MMITDYAKCLFKGLSAILSPNTGILDWAEVAKSYGTDFKNAGGDIYTGYEVKTCHTLGAHLHVTNCPKIF